MAMPSKNDPYGTARSGLAAASPDDAAAFAPYAAGASARGPYAAEAYSATSYGERADTLAARSPRRADGVRAWYERGTLPRRVGVVVPTRDRPDFLPQMLGALRMQSLRPDRILVVDDGEHPVEEVVRRYPGVEYLRARVGSGVSGNPARNAGLAALADLPYLCFLDDDDLIPPDYLEALLATLEADCRAAAAYPRFVFCGDGPDLPPWQEPWDPDRLGRTNLTGVPALIRTDALLQAGGWPAFAPDDLGTVPSDDWALWRRLRELGWRMAPAPVDYYYYRHDGGICRSRAQADHRHQWRRTVDPAGLVTLAVPWSGRLHLMGELLAAIGRQTFPAEHLHLLFYDNSGSEQCGHLLRGWLLEHAGRFAGHTYIRDPRPAVPGLTASQVADAPPLLGGDFPRRQHFQALNARVAAIWGRIGQLARTDLIWCLEDDVIPPADALVRLLDRMDPWVDGVTASYPSRMLAGRDNAWRYADLESGRAEFLAPGSGVERIGGSGLGCALVRREVFAAGPARSEGEAVGYDGNLWLDVARRGGTLLVDWDLLCEHRLGPAPAPAGR